METYLWISAWRLRIGIFTAAGTIKAIATKICDVTEASGIFYPLTAVS